MKRVTGIDWGCATLDVLDISIVVCDDEGSLELPHISSVDSKVRLQWKVHFDAFWNVDEAATAPHSTIERGQLVILRRNNRSEIFLHQLRMKLDSSISIAENDTLILKMFQKAVIDDLGLVLSAHSGQKFLLGFWNP